MDEVKVDWKEAIADNIFGSERSLYSFLSLSAKLDMFGLGNRMRIYDQCPNASWLKTYEEWNRYNWTEKMREKFEDRQAQDPQGRISFWAAGFTDEEKKRAGTSPYVRRGEKGIKITLPNPDENDERKFVTKVVFDVSQLENKPKLKMHKPLDMINALYEGNKVINDDKILKFEGKKDPDGNWHLAYYDQEKNILYIENTKDPDEKMLESIGREMTIMLYAEKDGLTIDRSDEIIELKAECVGYMIAEKYMTAPVPGAKLPEKLKDMNYKEKESFLEDVMSKYRSLNSGIKTYFAQKDKGNERPAERIPEKSR